MKALGILMVGAMAVAGGIAAATYLTKKKLDKENEDNYYDDWDNDNIDDDWDFEFDEDMEVEDEPAAPEAPAPAPAPQAEEPAPRPSSIFNDGIFGVNDNTGSGDT